MAKERTQQEIVVDIINKVDDLYWLLKCIQSSSFDEINVADGHMYAVFNAILRLLADIRNDAVKLN